MICTSQSLIGQSSHDHKATTVREKHGLSKVMGSAAIDTTVEGLHLRVWLITQRQHTTLMKGNKAQTLMGMEEYDPEAPIDPAKVNMAMDKEKTRLMMAGTHFIVAEIADSATGNEIVDPSAALSIVSPSRKRSSVELIRIMSNFGLGLHLKEKGMYHLTIDVNANGFSRIVHFMYTVR
jgi:hypothetical protein